MLNIFFLSFLIVISETLVIENGDKYFYKVDNLRDLAVRPDIRLVDDKRDTNKLDKQMYELVPPQEDRGREATKDDIKDYVIIKAKRHLFNISPYVMMRRLDDIKYMVVWLNLYCEMHPECNRDTLNGELNKIVYAVEKQQ